MNINQIINESIKNVINEETVFPSEKVRKVQEKINSGDFEPGNSGYDPNFSKRIKSIFTPSEKVKKFQEKLNSGDFEPGDNKYDPSKVSKEGIAAAGDYISGKSKALMAAVQDNPKISAAVAAALAAGAGALALRKRMKKVKK